MWVLIFVIVDLTALPGLLVRYLIAVRPVWVSPRRRNDGIWWRQGDEILFERGRAAVRFRLEVGKTARLLRSEAVNPTMHANGGLPLHELPKVVVLAVAQ